MKACIVGHGPSICNEKYGAEIDSFDEVIRLKRSGHFLEIPKIFGRKISHVMGSALTGQEIFKHWHGLCDSFWLFVDTRTEGMTDRDIHYLIASAEPAECVIMKELCEEWRNHYREIRGKIKLSQGMERKGRLSDDKGHLHPSAGTHAILYALDLLRPEVLRLYGFDNIATGAFTWSMIRGPEWTQYPDHNWETEQRMLEDIAEKYGYKIDIKDNCIIDLKMEV